MLLTVGQGGDGCDRFGEDGFGVWVLMLGVPGVRVGSAGGGLLSLIHISEPTRPY